MRGYCLALVVLLLLWSDATAGPIRQRFARSRSHPVATAHYSTTTSTTTTTTTTVDVASSTSALSEVNAARAARGLPPFLFDPALTIAAERCAAARAASLIAGHLSNDFAHLPAGSSAAAAGCGALHPSWGWGTCCTFERHTYAGAAMVYGRDGKRYMHLFVR